jgi:SAM-dependent methyltransferase
MNPPSVKRMWRGLRRRGRERLRARQRSLAIAIRWRYYVQKRRAPALLARRMGLTDDEAYATHKIEIGGGPHPQPGFVHVDNDPDAACLEALADAWSLPFPDSWADQLVAIHALEHIPPPRLEETLREWHRVLRTGGSLRVHVPNGPAIMQAFMEAPVKGKWRAMGSLLGQLCGPSTTGPQQLWRRSDHQIIFDAELLAWALARASFVDVADVSDEVRDRHAEAWEAVIPCYSLVMEARKE